jgi:hypothetical protein
MRLMIFNRSLLLKTNSACFYYKVKLLLVLSMIPLDFPTLDFVLYAWTVSHRSGISL